jgi:chorismate mutase
MADKLHDLLHEIHHVDEELISLLAKRVQLSQQFYAEETASKHFMKSAEKEIYERMKKIAQKAELDEAFVKKFYKQVTKHGKKHRKQSLSLINKKQKELAQEQKLLSQKKKEL